MTTRPPVRRLVLRVGDWEKTLDLNEFKYGPMREFYDEMKPENDSYFDLTGIDIIKTNWEHYENLLLWIYRGPDVFNTNEASREKGDLGRCLRKHNELPPVLYRDVAPIVKAVGINFRHWEVFTVLDYKIPATERFQVSMRNGAYVRKNKASQIMTRERMLGWHYTRRLFLDYLGWLREQRQLTKEEEEYVANVVEGLAHNSFLQMIAEGSWDEKMRSKSHNRFSQPGLDEEIYEQDGLNGAYVLWQDLRVLFENLDMTGPYTDIFEKRLLEGIPIGNAEYALDEYDVRPNVSGWLLSQSAAPVLYWRVLRKQPDDVELSRIGFGALINTEPSDDPVPIVSGVNRYYLQLLQKSPKKSIPKLYYKPYADFFASVIGQFALLKLRRILTNYVEKTGNENVKLFLAHLTKHITEDDLLLYLGEDEYDQLAKNDSKNLFWHTNPADTEVTKFAKLYRL